MDNGKVVRSVPVTRGKATWQASGQTRGTHRMTAEYHGDSSTTSSTSSSLVVTVKGKASSTKLAANDRDYRHGYRPTVTASVSPSGATGSVTFRDGSKVLGSAKVARGKAALRAPVLARGKHTVTATYNGSTAYAPSASSKITITVR
jgi:predicted secreted protein